MMLMTEARGRAGGPGDGADPSPDDADDDVGTEGSLGTDQDDGARPGASTLTDGARRASMRAVEDVVAGTSTVSDAGTGSFRGWLRSRLSRRDDRGGGSITDDAISDEGMATAEYAIATVAAAGFAGLLLVILRSDEVRGLLLGIVRGALSM